MLSVSELNEQAKTLLETHFSYVEVRGEISRLTKHGSGHWYFSLKDENASISCAMFKGANSKLKFAVEDGMSVVLGGKISLYAPSGSYQFIASTLLVDGEGALETAFKQLKEKLELEGLFSAMHKKPLPYIPGRIALVTSATSAALQDMLRITAARWQMAQIFIFDALTQGQAAPASLINALKKADRYGVDVIVLARGGGSREDLWCFNDEGLAREIFTTKTPVVSAIGHEIDYVISDFVADFRAPTPSAAMAELLPDESSFMQYLDELDDKLENTLNSRFALLENKLVLLTAKLSPNALKAKIEHKISLCLRLSERLDNALNIKFLALENNIKTLHALFEARSGFYEITKNMVQVRINGQNADLMSLENGTQITLVSQNGSREATITN
ncbi:exodeoxyribonuclease VII large subunit [Campylobacter suis]|uniref:Exodeoxyribonuclease 7 large subunit n=1 Tax=Campylobacter suis TaxID=2790657 RepID=A0ABM8Q0A5_9BACT|nr:exodeoxyribonuclease VII large subunit [Campylobacter suis]CAD7286234.1 Exodeoxyribonuclease 7 large subunit [Campylobacter suis]